MTTTARHMTGHADGNRPAEDDHLAVQADAAGDDGAQAEQGRQVEHIGSDDDSGAQSLLMTGDRGDGRRDLRCVSRQRGHYAEQRLRQAEPLADPLQPGHQDPANCQADQRTGDEGRNSHGKRHPQILATQLMGRLAPTLGKRPAHMDSCIGHLALVTARRPDSVPHESRCLAGE